jgi:hypothetical protein
MTQLRFEGKSVEEALSKARSACGERAKIVFAQRIKRKSVFGLRTRHHYEIVAEPSLVDREAQEETAVDRSVFAQELRAAVFGGIEADADVDTFERRSTRVERSRAYSEQRSWGEGSGVHGVSDEVEHMIRESDSQLPPYSDHVRVFRRDGSKELRATFSPPPWSGDEERLGDDPEQAEDGLGGIDGSPTSTSEEHRLRERRIEALRGQGWSEVVDFTASPSIIDLRSSEVLLSYVPDASERFHVTDDEPSGGIASSSILNLLHDLPQLSGPTTVIFAGRPGYDQGQSFISLCDIYGVRECDRFIFSSSPDVEVWGASDVYGAEEMDQALEAGRSVAMWIDDTLCGEVAEALTGQDRVLVAQVDLDQPMSLTEEYLVGLPGVQALCAMGAKRSSDPRVVFGLGLPVATVDGKISTVSTWMRLLRRHGEL